MSDQYRAIQRYLTPARIEPVRFQRLVTPNLSRKRRRLVAGRDALERAYKVIIRRADVGEADD